MGRTERDFRTLLVDTLTSIKDLYSSVDARNNVEGQNKIIQLTTFLEDLLSPYMNKRIGTEYEPKNTEDELDNVHYRIRNLMKVAQKSNLITPERITEDGRSWVPPTSVEPDT
jgi:hypothetical protein